MCRVSRWPRRTKSRSARSTPASTLPANSAMSAPALKARSRASEDHGADAGIRFQLIESRFERIDERVVERIELVGSMERENSDAVLHLSQEGRHAGELPAVRGRGHPHARSSSLHGCRTGNGGHFKNAGLARVFREGAALLAARASTRASPARAD